MGKVGKNIFTLVICWACVALLCFGVIWPVIWFASGGVVLDIIMLLTVAMLIPTKKEFINSKVIWIGGLFVPFLASIGGYFYVQYLDANHYWDEVMFGGLGEFIMSFVAMGCTGILLIGFSINLIVRRINQKKQDLQLCEEAIKEPTEDVK